MGVTREPDLDTRPDTVSPSHQLSVP